MRRLTILILALLAYALIKLIRALPNTPESQPEPDEQDSEGRGIWARLEADPAFRERMLRAAVSKPLADDPRPDWVRRSTLRGSKAAAKRCA